MAGLPRRWRAVVVLAALAALVVALLFEPVQRWMITGSFFSGSSLERPKGTAEAVATARAVSRYGGKPEMTMDDVYAEPFLSPLMRFLVQWALTRRIVHFYMDQLLPGNYEHLFVRYRDFDKHFREAIDLHHAEQIVLLGAGLDTRMLRFAEEMQQHRVRGFEIDLPATQKYKLHHWNAGIKAGTLPPVPEHVTLVGVDFEHDSLAEKLTSNGFDPKRKSHFHWEAVAVYLNPEAVNETLKTIHHLSAAGSTLAWDICDIDCYFAPEKFYGAKQLMRRVTATEPFLFGMSVAFEDVRKFHEELGYKLLELNSPETLMKKYLTRPDGSHISRPMDCYYTVLAEVVK